MTVYRNILLQNYPYHENVCSQFWYFINKLIVIIKIVWFMQWSYSFVKPLGCFFFSELFGNVTVFYVAFTISSIVDIIPNITLFSMVSLLISLFSTADLTKLIWYCFVQLQQANIIHMFLPLGCDLRLHLGPLAVSFVVSLCFSFSSSCIHNL